MKKKWRTPKVTDHGEAPTKPLKPEPEEQPEQPPFNPKPVKYLKKLFWRFLGVKDDK